MGTPTFPPPVMAAYLDLDSYLQLILSFSYFGGMRAFFPSAELAQRPGKDAYFNSIAVSSGGSKSKVLSSNLVR